MSERSNEEMALEARVERLETVVAAMLDYFTQNGVRPKWSAPMARELRGHKPPAPEPERQR